MDTVSLVEEVGFDALFTFIYSPRPGTKAAEMRTRPPGRRSRSGSTSSWRSRTTCPPSSTPPTWERPCGCWWTARADDPEFPLTSRTEGNRLVRLKGDKSLIGQFIDVTVTGSNTWALYGEAV